MFPLDPSKGTKVPLRSLPRGRNRPRLRLASSLRADALELNLKCFNRVGEATLIGAEGDCALERGFPIRGTDWFPCISH